MGLFQDARARARDEARKDFKDQADRAKTRMGEMAGRAEAVLKERPGQRILRKFSGPGPGEAPREPFLKRVSKTSKAVGSALARAGNKMDSRKVRGLGGRGPRYFENDDIPSFLK